MKVGRKPSETGEISEKYSLSKSELKTKVFSVLNVSHSKKKKKILT